MTSQIAYDYVRLVMEKEFLPAYLRFTGLKILRYEVTNIMELCGPLLRGLDQDDLDLRFEVTATIAIYLAEE